MEKQSLEAQRGEIRFRRLLVEQQVDGRQVLQDEYDASGIRDILEHRMEDTRRRMLALREQGVAISPYLEIGAERGQRALVLENGLGARGAAADLSFDTLRSTSHYGREFQLPLIPTRLVCDVHTLPFRSGTLPFVFCWETLHHFPEPGPVLTEVHRVLAPGGVFYFDEEPFQNRLRMPIRRAHKLNSREARRSSWVRRGFERLFSEHVCNEVEYGIIENHSISLGAWRKSLSIFAERDVTLESLRRVRSRLFGFREPLSYGLVALLGGSIRGLCRKAGQGAPVARIEDALSCPECLLQSREPSLVVAESGYSCPDCGTRFEVSEGVHFLLTREKMRQLYPEILC